MIAAVAYARRGVHAASAAPIPLSAIDVNAACVRTGNIRVPILLNTVDGSLATPSSPIYNSSNGASARKNSALAIAASLADPYDVRVTSRVKINGSTRCC